MKLLRFIVPALIAVGLAAAAPAANAVPYRQVYAQYFNGPFSVTDPECNATGQQLEQHRFDFYRCFEVTPDQVEELAGYIITG